MGFILIKQKGLKMSKLYLIRHGETEWNLYNKTQGCRDIPLNDNGRHQSMMLARRMSVYNIDKIYSSDLRRAVETASYIAEILKKDIIRMKEFREINFGLWEGLTFEEIKKNYPEEHKVWKETPHNAKIPGGEMLKDVYERVMIGLKKVLDESSNQDIVIVSHGGPIKLMVLGLLGIDISKYNRFRQDNTAVNIIEIYENRNAVLTLYNDTRHLLW